MTGGVQVRGNVTAEELAAILAVVAQPRRRAPDRFTCWRRIRLAALRRDLRH